MTETELVRDNVTTRAWSVDLAMEGKVKSPKLRPANRRRQKIVKFVKREGSIEEFSILSTMPYCGHETESPPSQAQYGAVANFFAEVCETRFQATTLLSARDYALVIAKNYQFTGERGRFLWFCITAFILSDKDIRARVRSWNIRNAHGDLHVGILHHKAYKPVSKFAFRLIEDMRGVGAEIFG